jgi:hypothetical protein
MGDAIFYRHGVAGLRCGVARIGGKEKETNFKLERKEEQRKRFHNHDLLDLTKYTEQQHIL